MGSKYKKALEEEWEGMSLRNIKVRTMKIKADKSLTSVIGRKYKTRGCRK